MSIAKDLPENAAELLRKIRKDYKVAFEPFRTRDVEIQLLKVQDLECVLKGRDPFKNVSEFPFWIKLWESAMVLADVAATLPVTSASRLLELGAGLGAPGLVAAAKGFRVTLSDYEQRILDFQRVSAAANGLKVECRFIDWTKPSTLKPFDTILGAEILFREDLLSPLLTLFDKLLAPGGSIYLAHDLRRKTLYSFLDKAQTDYTIKAKKIELTSGDECCTVMLNCLQRKN
ncbi:MAG: methyltransferase [Proteobacteria bacterium]|nr:methyltransferase [Desulfobulbaceae bacterium]MBU4151717.1 methyltransferase [Pseudomonadota bacterium]MDP2107212.1 methyltransferase [Desulfobulbaceae bacterium]